MGGPGFVGGVKYKSIKCVIFFHFLEKFPHLGMLVALHGYFCIETFKHLFKKTAFMGGQVRSGWREQ
jgi:hypothetical protein